MSASQREQSAPPGVVLTWEEVTELRSAIGQAQGGLMVVEVQTRDNRTAIRHDGIEQMVGVMAAAQSLLSQAIDRAVTHAPA